MKVEPKEDGSPIINIMCAECGEMFSRKLGHCCKEETEK